MSLPCEGKANDLGQAAKPAGQNEGRDVKMRREMFSMDAVFSCVSLAVMLWVVIAPGNHGGCFDDFFLALSLSISIHLWRSAPLSLLWRF